jgi:hypothetical protein
VSIVTYVLLLSLTRRSVRSIAVALISKFYFPSALIKTSSEARVLADCVKIQRGRRLKVACLLSALQIHKIIGKLGCTEK